MFLSILMISEGSCDTEATLKTQQKNKLHFKMCFNRKKLFKMEQY